MATFYFNGAALPEGQPSWTPRDWAALGNWWMDSSHTIPATSLPTSADDAILYGGISGFEITNTGSPPTVANLTLENVYLTTTVTVTGHCTFNLALLWYGTVNGNCTFNAVDGLPSYNDNGTVNGNCTFNDASYNVGTINGNCVFNDGSYNGSYNGGTINGGTINGNCIFNGLARNVGTIIGDCTFNDGCYHSSLGLGITGNCTFNDYAGQGGPVAGNCTYNDFAYSSGVVTPPPGGRCTFNGNAFCEFGAVFNCDCDFNDSASLYQTWYQNGIESPAIGHGGIVNGDCTFALSSAARHIDALLAYSRGLDPISGTTGFKYDKGVNGSSILGVV